MCTLFTEANQKNLTATNVTFVTTTRRPRPKATTEVTRGQEIGSSVKGILNSVGKLDIPGIVSNALSIREDNDETREYWAGLMQAIFCSPILNNFSSCGQR